MGLIISDLKRELVESGAIIGVILFIALFLALTASLAVYAKALRP
ncbi:hypothetical protein [Haliscomenobacter hydrossis]|uniref:Uncharacterized protein n=1 Tax=Haliscomenobacter hydrossis (strain ATCC 27775 / DSM 1100 / LMG 10767 / O) TaxID=760192 RepID=F4KZ81_HALH1|nr:hypothetical protein [Haliscomenobacter hydrossis]AEE53735.1 hypothetical protein Halhy_5912 [Haliscomenobacter hydrossis DSM 1100]